MASFKAPILVPLAIGMLLSGCGLAVPQKDPTRGNPIDKYRRTRQGKVESNIIANIRCEVTKGLYEAKESQVMDWLNDWGTTITLDLTWEDQSSLDPGFSYAGPIGTGKTFSVGTGLSLSAHATREETITFTLDNSVLLQEAALTRNSAGKLDCKALEDGTPVQSDLDIDGFIRDKTTIAGGNEARTRSIDQPQFSTFTDKLTFVAAYGGTVTPGWKLTRVSWNPSGTLAGATRTNTSLVVVTLGPLDKKASATSGPQLSEAARVNHNAALFGNLGAVVPRQ